MDTSRQSPALPSWSVLIINYNSGPDTLRCLTALRNTRPAPAEIIVVDNASADDSVTLLAEETNIRLIANAENLGFAGGANTGLAAASAPFVAVVNPDIVMAPDWPAALLRAFLADDSLGAAGGKLLYPDGTTIQAAGARLVPPAMRGENIGRGETDHGHYATERDVDFIPSSALMLRRRALDATGVFDAERFFPAFYADADLCFRLRKNGWRVRYIPGAVALHSETMTRDPSDPRVRFLSYVQRLQFAMKHLDRRTLLDEFLPTEQERFLEPERYAQALEQRALHAEMYAQNLAQRAREGELYAQNMEHQRAEAENYAHTLAHERTETEMYARSMEQRCADAENYARIIEQQRCEGEVYARSLEQALSAAQEEITATEQQYASLAQHVRHLEQRSLTAEAYATALEQQRTDAETYARSLEQALAVARASETPREQQRAEAEAYARALEERSCVAETYARTLEHARAVAERYAQELERRMAALEGDMAHRKERLIR